MANNKILIAEDDKFLTKIYESKLKKEGIAVVMSTNGQETLDLLRSEKPALLMLDLIMPTMSGFEVLEEINKDPELKKIPVIILSNLGQEADLEKGIALGAKDYIVKANVPIQEVIEKIHSYVKPENQAATAQAPANKEGWSLEIEDDFVEEEQSI